MSGFPLCYTTTSKLNISATRGATAWDYSPPIWPHLFYRIIYFPSTLKQIPPCHELYSHLQRMRWK